MGKGRIPQEHIYGELEKGTCKTGCSHFHVKDVCKKDMKCAAIDIESWELMVEDLSSWRLLVKEEIKHAGIHETCDKRRTEISEKPWAQ